MNHEIVAGDTLEVCFEGKLIGHLIRRSDSVLDIAFRYAEEWLSTPGAFPVSLSMPMDRRDHEPDVTYPWFLNLLPEGRALEIIGNVLKISELDVFAMLEDMGGDLPGAVEIHRQRPKGCSREPSVRPLTEAELAACIRRLPDRPVLVGEEGITMSAAGAQDKLPVILLKDGRLALPTYGMGSTHILKPRNKKFRDSVPNEAYCMTLARAAKLRAAPVAIGKAEDIEYLLVQRYDRIIEGKTIRRIHQEDLCQVAGYPPYLKYEWNSRLRLHGPGLKGCMDRVGSGVNKMRFFELMLFNVLVGNVDAHSKNYSLLIKRGGSIDFAPLYDAMNGDIYPDVTRNLAMTVATKQRGGHLHGRHWEHFAEENGMSSTQIKHRVEMIAKNVLAAAPDVVEHMEKQFGPCGVYKEISGYVVDYCRRMLSNLKTEPSEDADEAISEEGEQQEALEQVAISPP